MSPSSAVTGKSSVLCLFVLFATLINIQGQGPEGGQDVSLGSTTGDNVPQISRAKNLLADKKKKRSRRRFLKMKMSSSLKKSKKGTTSTCPPGTVIATAFPTAYSSSGGGKGGMMMGSKMGRTSPTTSSLSSSSSSSSNSSSKGMGGSRSSKKSSKGIVCVEFSSTPSESPSPDDTTPSASPMPSASPSPSGSPAYVVPVPPSPTKSPTTSPPVAPSATTFPTTGPPVAPSATTSPVGAPSATTSPAGAPSATTSPAGAPTNLPTVRIVPAPTPSPDVDGPTAPSPFPVPRFTFPTPSPSFSPSRNPTPSPTLTPSESPTKSLVPTIAPGACDGYTNVQFIGGPVDSFYCGRTLDANKAYIFTDDIECPGGTGLILSTNTCIDCQGNRLVDIPGNSLNGFDFPSGVSGAVVYDCSVLFFQDGVRFAGTGNRVINSEFFESSITSDGGASDNEVTCSYLNEGGFRSDATSSTTITGNKVENFPNFIRGAATISCLEIEENAGWSGGTIFRVDTSDAVEIVDSVVYSSSGSVDIELTIWGSAVTLTNVAACLGNDDIVATAAFTYTNLTCDTIQEVGGETCDNPCPAGDPSLPSSCSGVCDTVGLVSRRRRG